MREPPKITQANGAKVSRQAAERTKSIADIRKQANRIQQEIINRIGTPLQVPSGEGSRYRRAEEIVQRYMNNAMNSSTMQRAYRVAGGRPNNAQDINDFTSSFGKSREIQIPRSQYMRRRNNRR